MIRKMIQGPSNHHGFETETLKYGHAMMNIPWLCINQRYIHMTNYINKMAFSLLVISCERPMMLAKTTMWTKEKQSIKISLLRTWENLVAWKINLKKRLNNDWNLYISPYTRCTLICMLYHLMLPDMHSTNTIVIMHACKCNTISTLRFNFPRFLSIVTKVLHFFLLARVLFIYIF